MQFVSVECGYADSLKIIEKITLHQNGLNPCTKISNIKFGKKIDDNNLTNICLISLQSVVEKEPGEGGETWKYRFLTKVFQIYAFYWFKKG